MNKKIKVYMGIPSTGTRSDAQMYQLRQIEKDYTNEIELVYPEVYVGRIFHDFARNAYVEAFLKTDCDILWFLDSDVVPPHDILELVVSYGEHWQLAGAPYPVFMTPAGEDSGQVVMTVYGSNGKGLYADQCPTDGTAFVDGLATGCMFIKREILEQMKAPYFQFKFREPDCMMIEGEDLGFCRRVNEMGHQFFVDYSKVCRHYKTVDLLDVNNYARILANKSVEQYDSMIRAQVLELAKRNKELALQVKALQRPSGLIIP